MSCPYPGAHRGEDVVIAAKDQSSLGWISEQASHICVNELVDGSEDVLVPGNIVQCIWSILLNPANDQLPYVLM